MPVHDKVPKGSDSETSAWSDEEADMTAGLITRKDFADKSGALLADFERTGKGMQHNFSSARDVVLHATEGDLYITPAKFNALAAKGIKGAPITYKGAPGAMYGWLKDLVETGTIAYHAEFKRKNNLS